MASLKTLRLKKLENLNEIKEIVEGRTYYVESNNTLYRDVLSTRMAVGQVYFAPKGIENLGNEKTLTLSNVLVISNEITNQEEIDADTENEVEAQRSYVVGMYDENGEYIDLSTGFSVGVHTHKIDDVTGLQGALVRLDTALDGKAAELHKHLFIDITDVAKVDQIPNLPLSKIEGMDLVDVIDITDITIDKDNVDGLTTALSKIGGDITNLEVRVDQTEIEIDKADSTYIGETEPSGQEYTTWLKTKSTTPENNINETKSGELAGDRVIITPPELNKSGELAGDRIIITPPELNKSGELAGDRVIITPPELE